MVLKLVYGGKRAKVENCSWERRAGLSAEAKSEGGSKRA